MTATTAMLAGAMTLAAAASPPPAPVAVSAGGQEETARPAAIARFELAGLPVAVEGDVGSFALEVNTRTPQPGVEIATLRLRSDAAAVPPKLTLSWSLPAADVHGQWNSGARFEKALDPDWGPSRVRSMLARNAPVMSLFGADDGNRLTFAISEALNPAELSAGLREEDARVYGKVRLFIERHQPVLEAEIRLRFDRRAVPFYRALGEVGDWWASLPGFTPAPVPDGAREPMYSTWYSYHQNVEPQALLGEVEAAAAMGYEAIIIDDGWQTLDSHRGYAYTGDWRPERMPQMRQFVDAAHERGMKVLLWYSLPLVGEHSDVVERFRGRFLRYWDGQGAYVLDPRYPEVREHVIDTYRRAMREWGIDGFKLDFLGFLTANDDTDLTTVDGRDYASVSAATDRLMTDIMERLRELAPDILIEFRQPYIGPLMRKYGNMFRAGDSPNAAVDNRVRTVDLRILSGGTAVHSDMFMWNAEEPVEIAALQILNILFAVPQLSVRLHEIPADQLEMVRFWTGYWREHRDILLDGRFEPHGPLANYPMVAAQRDGRRVVALYQNTVVELGPDPGLRALDIVNATAVPRVVLRTDSDAGPFTYRVRDARGRPVGRGRVVLDPGAHVIEVPRSGLVSLQRAEPEPDSGTTRRR